MKVALTCLLISTSLFINAQNSYKNDYNTNKQIAFSHLSIEQGLSQNSVISIQQDSIGYMWFATQDGLNKYDGNSFKIYNKQFEDITRPTFSRLGKVYIDKQNRLWIITNSGKLEFYNPETDSFEPFKLFNNVSAIFQDTDLNFYVGTYGKGLYKINHKSKETLQLFKAEDYNKTVYSFYQDDDAIYIAATNAVFKLEENRYSPISIFKKQINYSCLNKTKDGTLWVGSYGNGLFYKTPNSKTLMTYENDKFPDIISSLNVEDLLVDKQNRLWVATYGNGAFLIDFKKNETLNFLENKSNPYAIHYNDILSLYQDNTGTVWLGSDGAGASFFDEHLVKFNVLTNKQMPKSVNIDVVRSISSDNSDNMWIGTSGKGLTYIDIKNNIYKTHSTNNTTLSSNRIISLSFQHNELWIGHQGYGLNIRLENGTFKSFPEISNYTIWRIIPHSKNQSWLCTENNGLILFNKNHGVIESYNTSNSVLSTNNIKTFVKSEDDIAWIGTENHGVFQLNLKTKKILKLEDIGDPIKSLLYNNGTLWVGTFGKGLKKYNVKTKEIVNYTKKDGLPNNVIYGILTDNNDNLWMSTNIGLSKLSFNKNSDKPTFENYNNYDGLQALEFNTGAYYKSPNGTLYFGGLEGVNWFHPNQLTLNTAKPKTVISGVSLFNKPIDKVENPTFKHSENTITFTFSSLHFSQPERNQFKYKLVNNDADWIDAGNNNIAHYTNLPPNDYEFQVISSNYDGFWNQTPATYNFKILKPWYLSHLAIILYALATLLLTYIIYNYFKTRLQMKMRLRLEHEETKRLKQLDEFKTKLYTNISHEFRTPLTLISGPVENQLNKPNLNKHDKKELNLVKRNANRLLNLVNQMLDLSKLESGKLQLKVSKGNIQTLLKQLAKAFEYKSKSKKINFSYKIDVNRNVWFDKDVIEKIVTNLLANAVKYTPENGNIHFKAFIKDDYIIINTINNGSTYKNEDLPKLFKRYYQTSKNSDGTGIGLSLIKELATLSHGNILANIMNTDDIQFTVNLPIERSYFSSSEIIEEDSIATTNQKGPLNNNDLTPSISLKEQPILLIVEDDEDIRQYVTSIFKDDYKIFEAKDGEQGIKKAYQAIPDLIISDIMMPKVSGIDLCNTLKHNEKTSHIPIILLTAKSSDASEIEGLKTGADVYVTKPFSTEKLKVQAQNLITLRQQLQKHYAGNLNIISDKFSSTDKVFINKLKDILDSELTNPEFNADRLSKLMQMNRMQLHRKLKALIGLSSTEFIKNKRLAMAKKLLDKTSLTTSEIAYQVGFNTPSYFTKCFKEVYKTTPSNYRLSR